MAYEATLQQQAEDEWGWEVRLVNDDHTWSVIAEGVGHDRQDALGKARDAARKYKRRQTWTPETVQLEV